MTMLKGDFPMNAVTVKNLTKVFRQGDEDVYAVDHVSFTVARVKCSPSWGNPAPARPPF